MECNVVCMSSSRGSYEQQYRRVGKWPVLTRHILNGNCISYAWFEKLPVNWIRLLTTKPAFVCVFVCENFLLGVNVTLILLKSYNMLYNTVILLYFRFNISIHKTTILALCSLKFLVTLIVARNLVPHPTFIWCKVWTICLNLMIRALNKCTKR